MALIRRVRVVWTGVAGSPAYSNFYFLNSEGDAQGYITPVGAFIASCVQYVHSSVTATVQPEVPLIDSVTGDITGTLLGTSVIHQGARTDEIIPPINNLLVRWNTQQFNGGRRIKGRMFVPYPTQLLNADGKVETSSRNGLLAAAQTFVNATGPEFVIWSRTTGAVAPVTQASVWDQFAALRSRRD